MLLINIPETELFDESTDRFITIKAQTLKLEHSLISISKWESRWNKPFLKEDKKTPEQIRDYIRCMSLVPLQDDNVVLALSSKNIEKIMNYIEAPMTATTVSFFDDKKPKKKEIMTSELIYYYMIQAQIPFECEKWHINRLFALLKVCAAKSSEKQKTNTPSAAKSQAALNAARRSKLKSRG